MTVKKRRVPKEEFEFLKIEMSRMLRNAWNSVADDVLRNTLPLNERGEPVGSIKREVVIEVSLDRMEDEVFFLIWDELSEARQREILHTAFPNPYEGY